MYHMTMCLWLSTAAFSFSVEQQAQMQASRLVSRHNNNQPATTTEEQELSEKGYDIKWYFSSTWQLTKEEALYGRKFADTYALLLIGE